MVNETIAKVRSLMEEKGLDVYVVSKYDPHFSEYSDAHFNTVKFMSNFSGSTAKYCITKDEASIFLDGRYHIQGEDETSDNEVKVYKLGLNGVPTMDEYIGQKFAGKDVKVGLDFEVTPLALIKSIENALGKEKVQFVDLDLTSPLWTDRPAMRCEDIFEYGIEFSGESTKDKFQRVKDCMKKDNTECYVISTLEDIAWLLNLRGDDVLFTPVFNAYVVIENDTLNLFVDKSKLKNVKLDSFVEVHDYKDIYTFLGAIDKEIAFVDTCNYKLVSSLKNKKLIKANYTIRLKGFKNEVEINNAKKAQVKDSAALAKAACYIIENAHKHNEYDVTDILTEYRSKNENYISPSFGTIAGYKGNGAMAHYSAPTVGSKELDHDGILLIDSGAQYFEGTTDITRTFTLGNVTEQQIMDYTLVLKSLISLSTAIFPAGTTGIQLDTIARLPLWKNLLDYNHGTGHGIGQTLGVHEGPCGFGLKLEHPMEKDFVTSCEPALYRPSEYGIRIENTLVCRELKEVNGITYLNFETISYFPYDLKLVDKNLLTVEEINWVNEYNKKTFELLSPSLEGRDLEWLKENTKSL